MTRPNKRKAQGLLEYALIVALLALSCLAILSSMGSQVVNGLVGNVSSTLASANNSIISGS